MIAKSIGGQSRIRSTLLVTTLLVVLAAGVAIGGPGIVAAEEAASSDGELSVETGWWDTTSESSALVEANLTDAGDQDVADVWIEYRVYGADEWSTTASEPGQAPESIIFKIDNLEPATVYEYRAVAESTGETDRGERRTFTTWWDGPNVTVDEPTKVGEESATFVATVEDLLDGPAVEVWFSYEPVHSDEFFWNWEQTPTQIIESDGRVTQTVSGLEPGTEYEVDVTVRTDSGYEYRYDPITFATVAPFDVETGDATDVSKTEATLTGAVEGVGTGPATVGFEYRPVDADDWSVTDAIVRNSSGDVAIDVSDLEPGTAYEFRIVGESADGTSAVGSIETFETLPDPVVETGSASDVDEASATVTANLVDLGGADDAAVAIQYRAMGDWTWTETDAETLSTAGTVETTLDALKPETTYEYRAAVRTSGVIETGEIATLTTEADETGPTVERLSGNEDSPPNPHAELAVDWAVGDEDGDLAAVTVTIRDGSGDVVDRRADSIGGGDARGSLETRVKHGAGDVYEVTLEVEDDAGNTASERATIRA